MATTYYAWSEFPGKAKPGDKVSTGSLDVSAEQFEEFVATGVVRDTPYPEEIASGDFPGSPAELAKRDLAIMAGHIESDDAAGVGVTEKAKSKDEDG